MSALYRIFRAFAMQETGQSCRRCGEGIVPADAFGMSEGVCPPCRA